MRSLYLVKSIEQFFLLRKLHEIILGLSLLSIFFLR